MCWGNFYKHRVIRYFWQWCKSAWLLLVVPNKTSFFFHEEINLASKTIDRKLETFFDNYS